MSLCVSTHVYFFDPHASTQPDTYCADKFSARLYVTALKSLIPTISTSNFYKPRKIFKQICLFSIFKRSLHKLRPQQNTI